MTRKELLLNMVNTMCKEEYPIPNRIGVTLDDYILNSFRATAIRELREFVSMSQEKDPVQILENFRAMADSLACSSTITKKSFRYSVMADIGTYVLDEYLICNMEEL